MTIIINGERKEFEKELTLQEVVASLGLEGKVMAAAINMEIVKQDKWADTLVHNGDKLELLDFVGGG